MNIKWRSAPHLRAAMLRIGASLSCLIATAAAPPTDAMFAAIRAGDMTLARIGYRLATANAPLCDALEPGLGLLLHTPTQYAETMRAAAEAYFRFDGPLGVEGVVAGSPAAIGGILPNDTILAIGAARFALVDPRAKAGTAALTNATTLIATLSPDQAVTITGRRSGAAFQRTVTPIPACRARFELTIDPGFPAVTDGDIVQIGNRFLESYPDDLTAAVVAHELAHTILHHRARLADRGVTYGILSGFGGAVRYFRQTELEADILSVSLLANAGYDPSSAVRFWEAFGPAHNSGIRSRTHPAWRDRVVLLARTIAALGSERPTRPAILATRDRPLDGNWQALLAQ